MVQRQQNTGLNVVRFAGMPSNAPCQQPQPAGWRSQTAHLAAAPPPCLQQLDGVVVAREARDGGALHDANGAVGGGQERQLVRVPTAGPGMQGMQRAAKGWPKRKVTVQARACCPFSCSSPTRQPDTRQRSQSTPVLAQACPHPTWGQRYSSVRPAPCPASSVSGATVPCGCVDALPQVPQGGLLTQWKKSLLNQASSSWARAAPKGVGEAGLSSACPVNTATASSTFTMPWRARWHRRQSNERLRPASRWTHHPAPPATAPRPWPG